MLHARPLISFFAASGIVFLATSPGHPAEEKAFTVTLKDHRFTPQTLTVPADEAFALTVINTDATAEEFESTDFHVEKVIGGGKQMTFHVGPLAAGNYGFFGERHGDTAIGTLFAQ